MSIRTRDFIGKAEGIRNHEVGLKTEINQLERQIDSLEGHLSSLESQEQSLSAELSAAYYDTDEDGNVDYVRISALQSSLSMVQSQISSVESQISSAESELSKKQSELQATLEEKDQTLFEIQERAQVSSQNMNRASGMCGDYANIGARLSDHFSGNIQILSQAAGILGGHIGSFGGSGGGVPMAGSSAGKGGSHGTSGKSHSVQKGLSGKKGAGGSASSASRTSSQTSGLSAAGKKGGGFSASSGKTKSTSPGRSQQKSNSTIKRALGASPNGQKNASAGKAKPSGHQPAAKTAKTSQTKQSTAKAFQKSSSSSPSSKRNRSAQTPSGQRLLASLYARSNLSMSPAERLSDYMNKHNYGIGDYEKYSTDPEWISLHRAVFHGQNSRYLAHEKACSDYHEWQKNGGANMAYTATSYAVNVSAKDIFDVRGANDSGFWEYKTHSQQDYVNMARQIPIVRQYLQSGLSVNDVIAKGGLLGACAANYFQSPVKVARYKDSYIHLDDGRHRVEAAKIAGVDMPVTVVQEYGFAVKSMYSLEDKVAIAEQSGGQFQWAGSPGNSVFSPQDSRSAIAKELKKYGLSGIEYKNGEPDFSPISCFEVTFPDFPALYEYIGTSIIFGQMLKKDGSVISREDFSKKIRSKWQSLTATYVSQRIQSDAAFAAEFEKRTGIKTSTITSAKRLKEELKNKGLSMHETTDCTQIQFVPTAIHKKFHHIGGAGEMMEHLLKPYSHMFSSD